MSLNTLNDIFFTAVAHNLDRAMLYRESGAWQPISSSDLHCNVAGTVRALQGWGIHKGDRVAIVSENRPEWTIADFAILLLGAVTVPVYSTLTPEQTAYTLRDSESTVVFVSSEHQLRKMQAILPQTQIKRIVVMDRIQIPADLPATCTLMDQFMTTGPLTLDAETESVARAILPGDPATIIYTSGTTGTSKGAVLTHGNIASNIVCSLLGFHLRRRTARPRTRRMVCRYRHSHPRGLWTYRDFPSHRGEHPSSPQTRNRRQTACECRSADC
jgi:long-chain acyl-CoA synthetase